MPVHSFRHQLSVEMTCPRFLETQTYLYSPVSLFLTLVMMYFLPKKGEELRPEVATEAGTAQDIVGIGLPLATHLNVT